MALHIEHRTPQTIARSSPIATPLPDLQYPAKAAAAVQRCTQESAAALLSSNRNLYIPSCQRLFHGHNTGKPAIQYQFRSLLNLLGIPQSSEAVRHREGERCLGYVVHLIIAV